MSTGRHNFAGEALSVRLEGLEKENATLRELIEKHWDLNAVNNSIFKNLSNHGSKSAREKLLKQRDEIAEDIANLEGEIGLEVRSKSPVCGTSQRNKKLMSEPLPYWVCRYCFHFNRQGTTECFLCGIKKVSIYGSRR